jgi:hypothetical protein
VTLLPVDSLTLGGAVFGNVTSAAAFGTDVSATSIVAVDGGHCSPHYQLVSYSRRQIRRSDSYHYSILFYSSVTS